VLQWGGAVLVGLAYYLLPLGLGHDQLFVLSMAMGLMSLVVVALVRARGTDTRGPIIGLVIVVAVFALFMVVRSDTLATGIDGNMDKYFRVQDPAKVLGVEVTPVACAPLLFPGAWFHRHHHIRDAAAAKFALRPGVAVCA
jgi:Kef-type K+ transport system membrane component KefB